MVIAGIADFARPASQLSRNNAASLVVNGVIATRFYWVVIPRNFTGMTCSVFLACVGTI